MADQSVSRRLRRTTVVYSAVVMFLVGLAVALVGVLPLAKRLREAEQRNLLVEVLARTGEAERFVSRARAAAGVGNRTKIRELLESWNRGGIGRPELATAAEPVVRESMARASNVVGVILFDNRSNALLRVGKDIPPARWPPIGPTNRDAVVEGPFLLDGEKYVVGSAPALSLALEPLGHAVALYRLEGLQKVLEDPGRLRRTGEVILGAPGNKELPVFFPLRQRADESSTSAARVKTILAALKLARNNTDVLDPVPPLDDSMVLAYGPIKGTDWGLVVTRDKRELFSATNRALLVLGSVLAVLILLGMFGMVVILRPLTGRLLLQADELESQIYEKTAALNTELAERKRAEDSLRDSEALYHSLVDTLPLNVLRKDLKGQVTFGNRSYCELMGQTLEQLLGKTDRDLFPPELAEKYVRDDDKVVNTGRVFEDVEEHRKPDGKRLYVHVIKAPVRDAKGNIVGTQVIFWDETARKLAEQERQRALSDLARSNKELEQFAYVASHDLQEPLRMIASYTELLARRYQGKLDREADEFIGYAVEGATRMHALINDLLTYAHVGTRSKPFALIDCNEALNRALDNLKIVIEDNQAVVRAEPLPKVMGDDTQLTQLFQNLLSNAIKFRGQRPPEIQISAELKPAAPSVNPSGRDGAVHSLLQEWVFTVRDNGIGIEREYFDRIFVIFQRLHGRDEYPGTGAGLAVCRKIVERHEGRIWVESEPGRGSTFHFTVPHRGEFSI